MAFKMKGFPKLSGVGGVQKEKELTKDLNQLLETEHKDTHAGSAEDIGNLEDRIGFIKEDGANQDGGLTDKQKADIKTLQAKIKKLRKKK